MYQLCKVRFDGFNRLAQPYKNVTMYSPRVIAETSEEDLGFERKSCFINEWYKEKYPFGSKGKKKLEGTKKEIETELKQIYVDNKENLKNEKGKLKVSEMKELLLDHIDSNKKYKEYFEAQSEDLTTIADYYVDKFINRQSSNLKARKLTFKRKAFNNDWNYFVTFTYDDKKHNEESFVKVLKKKLQNLHDRKNWLYMGAFERSKTGRLHFHGLIYVPQGEMVGNLEELKYYDTTSHKIATAFINDDFTKRIGRNDFKVISKNDFTFATALNYILKYIGKSNERIVYSRGIKSDVMCLLDFEGAAICKLSKDSPYYVMIDTPLILLNKELGIATN